jgi:hypothetical protein
MSDRKLLWHLAFFGGLAFSWLLGAMLFRGAPVTGVFATLFSSQLPIWVFSFISFARLIKAEYESDHVAWEADDKPSGGLLWRAKECTFFGSRLAAQRLYWIWLFRTPTWTTKATHNGALWLRRYRAYTFAGLALCPVIVVYLFCSLARK